MMKKLLLAGVVLCAFAPGARAASGDGVGAYYGGGTPDAFGTWLGNTMTVTGDFLNASGWASFETLVGSSPLSTWVNWEKALPGRRLVTYGIPPFAWGVSANYTACAAGSYNSHYTTLANNIISSGIEHIDLRIAWEFDGDWTAPAEYYPNGDSAHFVGCWQQIVNTIRAVDTNHVISFDWNPTAGCCSYLSESYWPGDQYVDYVGMDLYANTASIPQVLTDISAFAQKHGKKITFPEWGVWNAEDTNYIQTMANFIKAPSNNVAWANYFEIANDANHNLQTSYPQSGAVYKQNFTAPFESVAGMWPSSSPPPPPPPPPPSGVAQLDPNHTNSGFTLSSVTNTDDTATYTASAGVNRATYGNIGVTTSTPAKVYWEQTFGVTTISKADAGIGLTTSSVADDQWLGEGADTLAYYGVGNVWYNNSVVATIATYTTSGNVGIAVDSGACKIWFRVNGGSWDNKSTDSPATNAGGIAIPTTICASGKTIVPGASINPPSSGSSVKMHFPSTSWAYAAPSGFVAIGGSSPPPPAEALTVNQPPYHGVGLTITGTIQNLSSPPSAMDMVVNGTTAAASCSSLTATGFSCAWTPAAAGAYTIQVKDHATGAASPAVNVTIN